MKIIMKKAYKKLVEPTILPGIEEMEIWVDAPFSELKGFFKISSFGNVLKLKNGKWTSQKLSKVANSDGYFKLSFNNKFYRIHQLVCRAFHGTPPTSEHTTDHIDRCCKNNYYKNLKWSTRAEQDENRSYKNLHKGKRPVVQFTKEGEFVQLFESGAQALKAMNITNSSALIYRSCKSDAMYLSYHWAYLDVCEIIEG